MQYTNVVIKTKNKIITILRNIDQRGVLLSPPTESVPVTDPPLWEPWQ